MSKEKILYDILNSIQECNTISDLANKLFISQPYISRTIKNAEKKYNTTLIHRKENPIRLTQAGEIVLNNLRKIIETRNELQYDLLPYQKTEDFQLKVAINQPWLETSADFLLEFLLKEFPNITFSFYERTTNLAQKELLNHSIDLFIGKFLTNKDIVSTYITQSELYLITPENLLPYEIKSNILHSQDLKFIDNLPFISLTDDSFFQAMVDNFFTEHEIKIHKIIKVENSIAAIKLAVKGYGSTIAPRNIADEIAKKYNAKIKAIYIPENLLQLSIGISYLENSHGFVKKIAQKICEFLKSNSLF
ncbi:DNA-binding transcriptional LysR family regulator [Lactobacillus colini]|uniref:DNA-binding transcriptional LysR family regulator n=1 Tax=Lactobacillus colini TaxID=1819254 RepID=A0ABS4MGP5_9LACO|nr:LysR family transcriptional regulator [Lactobacillus colini]MBP2058883.1 DNA-binding transcriptional LysR family regulator [Lactobacillus colini]